MDEALKWSGNQINGLSYHRIFWHKYSTFLILTSELDLHAVWHSTRIPFLGLVFIVVVVGGVRRHLQRSVKQRLYTGLPDSPNSVEKYPDDYNNLVNTRDTSSQTRQTPKRVIGKKQLRKVVERISEVGRCDRIDVQVFYASITGGTETSAKDLVEQLSRSLIKTEQKTSFDVQLLDLAQIEYDDYFLSTPKSKTPSGYFYLFLIPTYDIDTILDTFLAHLQETHYDFRIDTAPLRALLGYSVFGFGDVEGWPTEETGFCAQAKQLDKWMARLTGRKRAFPLGLGDVKSDGNSRLQEWRVGIEEVLLRLSTYGGSLGEGVVGSGDAIESDEDDDDDDDDDDKTAKGDTSKGKTRRQAVIDDMEEMGRGMQSAAVVPDGGPPLVIDFTTTRGSNATASTVVVSSPIKEMVPRTSPTYAALTKQGYTIIGSHSGVKICRWTKSALRGRGSCYKHSFYGIRSHLCMEATPSLSCSNKCVFCWRHGTNPVGTTWRWTMDPPDMIYQGAKEGHYRKIRMMRGVPGVRADRFAEAFRIRHCALSLVGEPIFYPRINELISLLHRDRISTFLVCNGQHPDQLATLERVTQLYVSVDASNRESLRRIDRPLHRDFWERFLACLDILRQKRFIQRTVFRLTLVKGFNVEDEVQGYADLILRAMPCFIEIKGVTFCGTTTTTSSSSSSKKVSGLTMGNVPFHSEVVAFAQALNEILAQRLMSSSPSTNDDDDDDDDNFQHQQDSNRDSHREGYGIAAEHSHSCCILLASTRFFIDGRWHTTIDYDAFFGLLGQSSPPSSSSPTNAATTNPNPTSATITNTTNTTSATTTSIIAHDDHVDEVDLNHHGDGNNGDHGDANGVGNGNDDYKYGGDDGRNDNMNMINHHPPFPFRPEDYIGPPTPSWALFGQGGFDPLDQRVYTKGKKAKMEKMKELK